MAKKVAKKIKKASICVVMEVEKETKNTFRYKEVTKKQFDRQMIGTLYLPKDICKGAEVIAVSIAMSDTLVTPDKLGYLK